MKLVCRDCKTEKDISQFPKHKLMALGVNSFCKSCNVLRVAAWRRKGKRNAGEESRRYAQRYPEKVRAKAAKRRTSVLNRTPPWVNFQEIESIYLWCPEGYHVDHIVPLQGELVSGLHVPWNLQYLPATTNLSKGNKW